MLALLLSFISYVITIVVSHDVISGETVVSLGTRKAQKHEHNENRRFYQDLEDDEWHIAHVKDMLLRRSSCDGETYEDRVEKYRKSLQDDGSRVEFVSAEPLPINQTDLNQNNTCKAQNFTDVFIKPDSWKNIKKTLTADDKKSLNDTKDFTADVKSASNDTARRTSDYQFSNEEYYDEEVEFDPRECPTGVLEVHELDIDHLKPYDIECELSIEWRSLDSTKDEWTKQYG